VIGFGGGSALDAAKAIAALTTNPGDLLDYLEVIGKGQPLQQAPLPFIAIPTTAGTGSEVTRNAVLGSPEHRVKVSLRSPQMLAKVAIVDPELSLGLPPDLTASTGMDALTQCIEAYVSCKANPMTDVFCADGLRRAARSLRVACADGCHLEARIDMALASLYSGIALANGGLGAVHGLAGPMGGMFAAPHGAVCAALLPHVMQVNLAALRSREPRHPVLERFAEIARWLTGDEQAGADDAVTWLQQLQRDLRIPGLRAWGVAETDFPSIIEKASAASSMKGNPLRLTDAEMWRAIDDSQ
jgi:alcohol dehydrogenase class IV